jgi:phosphoglycolate phosphatase
MTADKRPNIRLLVFDLDGTLINSETDLVLSVNAMRAQFGLQPLAVPVIASYVGRGVVALVQRALQDEVPEKKTEDAVIFFTGYYRRHMLDHTVAYPGVKAALAQLGDRTLAVLSNKPAKFSRRILEGLGMLSCFSFVYGGDSLSQKKPDPVGVVRLMQETGCAAVETMIVGDSDVDIQTARNAGVWSCGVSYGIGSKSLANASPDFIVDDLRELPPLLNGTRPPRNSHM